MCSLLAMEPADQHRLADYMSIHRVHDRVPRLGRDRSRNLTLRLWDVELGIERVKLERVVVIRTGRGPWPHIAVRPKAQLACAIRQLSRLEAFRQTR